MWSRSSSASRPRIKAPAGFSRRIGYVWLARYAADGRRGLVDRSHAPRHCPHKIRPAVAELLIAERTAHPFWGARKLLAVLARRHPRMASWPAASTVADLLARHGLVHRRRRRRTSIHPGIVRLVTTAPNDLWTADFKGQFRTGDGEYCYPLTIADQHTRFLLSCHGLLRLALSRSLRLRMPAGPAVAFAWDELLMPLGRSAQSSSIGQNRATVGMGFPLTSRQRLEVGYMHLTNVLAARRANEINHTLWLSWHPTGSRPATRPADPPR